MLEIVFQGWTSSYTPPKKRSMCYKDPLYSAIKFCFSKEFDRKGTRCIWDLCRNSGSAHFFGYDLQWQAIGVPSQLPPMFSDTCIFLSYAVDKNIAHHSIVSVPCKDGDGMKILLLAKPSDIWRLVLYYLLWSPLISLYTNTMIGVWISYDKLARCHTNFLVLYIVAV